MRNKTFIITVIFCLLPLFCKGQFCKLYTTHGEISSSMINNIYQDQKGYIWVTTEDGVNKFDGAKFTSYRTHKNDSTSLIGNHVYKVFQDSKGHLYILSTKGLQIYDYRSDTFKTIKKSSPSYNNKSITELRNGNILIGTSGYGIKTLSTDHKENFLIQNWNPSLSGYTINEIMEDKMGISGSAQNTMASSELIKTERDTIIRLAHTTATSLLIAVQKIPTAMYM